MTLSSVDVDIDTTDPYYDVRIKHGLTKNVTKEYLSYVEEERLLYIPITCEKVKDHAKYISLEILQSLLHSRTPTSLMKDFLNLHERLGHVPFVIMFKLCSIGPLLDKCLVLQSAGSLSFLHLYSIKA